MEYIIILIFMITMYLILRFIFSVDLNKLKAIGENAQLNNIVSKYPENIEICKHILRKLNNNKTIIQEDKEANTTMFLILGNKILIANLKDNFTRIQTIAHECLHSIQDKKILWFNFIYSNIYLLYFVIITILISFKIVKCNMLLLIILLILGLVYYVVRIYLENDAMIKARFLAKEYMEEINISDKEEIEQIVSEYDKLNDIGIKCVNFKIFESVIIKCIIFLIVSIVVYMF